METMGGEVSRDVSDDEKGPAHTHSHIEREVRYCGFDIGALPGELFMYVLMFVPAPDLVRNCSLVCKHWLQTCRDQLLWRRMCEREGKYVASLMGPPPEDFAKFYFRCPYTSNLLRNCTAESLHYWRVENSHPSIQVETSPVGADAINLHIPEEEIGGRNIQNWVSSYTMRTMSQRINLLEETCAPLLLDELRPPIHVSAWCAARLDCGSRFVLDVKLLGVKGEVLEEVNKEKEMTGAALRRAWHKVEHTFTDYKPGVRTVVFTMGGIDTQFWRGNYGPKFTLPCVRFVFDS